MAFFDVSLAHAQSQMLCVNMNARFRVVKEGAGCFKETFTPARPPYDKSKKQICIGPAWPDCVLPAYVDKRETVGCETKC